MASIIRYLTSALFTLLALSSAFGADGSTARKDVEVEFSVFARTPLTDLVYYPAGQDHPNVALTSYATSRSAMYRYKGKSTLKFYVVHGEQPARVVAELPIPENAARLFLLFSKRKTPTFDGLLYDITSVDEGREKLTRGHFVIINATSLTYQGFLNSGKTTIFPGVNGPFVASDATGINLYRSDLENAPPAVSESFSVGANESVIVVFFPPTSPTGLRPVVRRLLSVDTKPGGK